MSYEHVKNFRNRLKERATYVLGNVCQCCGYDVCQAALEFHHINPEEKEFNFNANSNRSWEATKQELKKCILVCANCHREIHAGLIDNSTLTSSYNEQRALEIDQKVADIKTHNINYCKKCGVEISKGSEYCWNCAFENRRKVERPEREELKMLIRNLPFTEIARKFLVSDNAIRKWCKAIGLPSSKKEINSYSDEEWEKV